MSRRTIQRDIEDSIAEKILFGELTAGSIVVVDVAEGADVKSSEPFTFTGETGHVLPDEVPAELTDDAAPTSAAPESN